MNLLNCSLFNMILLTDGCSIEAEAEFSKNQDIFANKILG